MPLRPLAPRAAMPLRFRGDTCLLYTSDAAGEGSSVDLGGCRIIKKKKRKKETKKKTKKNNDNNKIKLEEHPQKY